MKVFNIIDSFKSDTVMIDIGSNSIAICNDEGKHQFDITLNKDGSLEVMAYGTLLLNDVILDSTLLVEPRFSNNICVHRKVYKE